jgi:hypothetical protein
MESTELDEMEIVVEPYSGFGYFLCVSPHEIDGPAGTNKNATLNAAEQPAN